MQSTYVSIHLDLAAWSFFACIGRGHGGNGCGWNRGIWNGRGSDGVCNAARRRLEISRGTDFNWRRGHTGSGKPLNI